MEAVAVELKNVSKSYGENWDLHSIITDFNLLVKPGKLTALVGPSGCGKTTLVNLIAGFDQPDEGSITVAGIPVTGPGHKRMVVFQETTLLPWLTTYQNVVFGPKIRGDLKGAELRREAEEILDKVGLKEFMDKYPLQLSGGMQRRAELARAIINQPELMIMDEPFRGLDAMTRQLMQEFFLRLYEESQRTHLFVTSELDEAIFLADSVVVLSNTPTRVRDIIEIELPRPRNFHMLTLPEVYNYKKRALEILHEEALKSFGAGAQDDYVRAFSAQAK